MKKLLLLFLSSTTFVSAQVLLEENFNSLTVGDVSTEIAGTTPGQGDFLFFASNGTAPTTSTNALASNAQIVDSGNESLGLQIEGPNGNKGSRYMWKDGFADLWSGRTVDNEIIELELDINPGDGTTASRNTFGAYIFNAAGDRILAGFHVRAATRELFLVAYSTPTGNPVGNYNYSLAAAPGIQIPESTFSRIGVSYNKTTGEVIIKGPGIDPAGLSLTSSSPATDPAEIDFVSFSGNTTAIPNTLEATMVMDNLVVRASATDTLLGVSEITNVSFGVSPNPAKDVVTITSDEVVNSVELFDINGRTVLSIEGSNQINVSDLSSGIYMMKIASDKGTATKKLVVE
ncbi:MAG: T9SS type A sorting domain-containing protein [Flavobacteriales bacterium]|nr:T9SS type A sorting domain-containing protein [Flavobacteriales bacterium]